MSISDISLDKNLSMRSPDLLKLAFAKESPGRSNESCEHMVLTLAATVYTTGLSNISTKIGACSVKTKKMKNKGVKNT